MTSPTAPTIDASGIKAPAFADILTYLKAQYRSIYGSNVYLENDSQDGQFLGIVAAAINDANAAAIAVYNSFSPATAQGNGLASRVKMNGIQKLVPSNSTVNLTLTGVAGTTISNGIVADSQNNNWLLPASVVIPPAGSITVTATAQNAGAINASAGTVTTIQTPVFGWQTVTNASAATPGNPVESDAALRVRQGVSVALPSLTVLSGIVGAVQSISGVTQAKAYENDTNSTDGNGLPPHSISMVVQGGDATAIATAIMNKKTPGAYTYGTTLVNVADSVGITHPIRFYTPTLVPIAVSIQLHALTGYTSAIAAEIQAAVAAYINALGIGQGVMITRLYVPVQLSGSSDSLTFEVVSVLAAAKPGTPGATDVAIAFNQLATCQASDVAISVV